MKIMKHDKKVEFLIPISLQTDTVIFIINPAVYSRLVMNYDFRLSAIVQCFPWNSKIFQTFFILYHSQGTHGLSQITTPNRIQPVSQL